MKRQPHSCLLRNGYHGLQKISYVLPHFVDGMSAFGWKRRQDPSRGRNQRRLIPRLLGPSLRSSLPPPVCVKVVLDDGQTGPTGRANGLL